MISDNFRLDYQNDLKFSQSHPVGKSNVSWKFGENMSQWRHYDVTTTLRLLPEDLPGKNANKTMIIP